MKIHASLPCQRGLSMIEVLAAMVIFSAGAVVLFGWIGQAANRLSRLGVEQQKLFAELAALEFAKTLNPSQQPAGSTVIGGVNISWQAVPVGEESAAFSGSGGNPVYMIQLYRLQLQVRNEHGGRADKTAIPGNSDNTERSLYLAGWRQLRDARPANPFANASNAIK